MPEINHIINTDIRLFNHYLVNALDDFKYLIHILKPSNKSVLSKQLEKLISLEADIRGCLDTIEKSLLITKKTRIGTFKREKLFYLVNLREAIKEVNIEKSMMRLKDIIELKMWFMEIVVRFSDIKNVNDDLPNVDNEVKKENIFRLVAGDALR